MCSDIPRKKRISKKRKAEEFEQQQQQQQHQQILQQKFQKQHQEPGHNDYNGHNGYNGQNNHLIYPSRKEDWEEAYNELFGPSYPTNPENHHHNNHHLEPRHSNNTPQIILGGWNNQAPDHGNYVNNYHSAGGPETFDLFPSSNYDRTSNSSGIFGKRKKTYISHIDKLL